MYTNTAQKKIIHVLMAQAGLTGVKEDLAHSYSEGRTTHISELYLMQAAGLIGYLKTLDPNFEADEKMRRKIIAKAHKMRWETSRGKADMIRIDNWCLKYGGFGKKLNQHSHAELVKLVTQFDQMYRKFINQF